MTDKLENPLAFANNMQDGMTLRDYFAAHAPIMTEQWMRDSISQGEHWIDANVAFAYKYADAMLAARLK